jgi:hypothetical protein
MPSLLGPESTERMRFGNCDPAFKSDEAREYRGIKPINAIGIEILSG